MAYSSCRKMSEPSGTELNWPEIKNVSSDNKKELEE